MDWRRLAPTIAVAFAGLILVQGGCVLVPRSPVTEAAGTPTSDPASAPVAAADATHVADTPSPRQTPGPRQDPPTGPARSIAISPVPAASPSGVPKPNRPVAASSPVSDTSSDVLVVTLAKDNRVALVDPVGGKVMRTVDISRPGGQLAVGPDGRSAWVFGPQPGQAAIALFDVLSGDRHEDVRFRDIDNPASVAFSSDGLRAYVALAGDPSGSTTIAFASITGKEFGRITLGRQSKGVQLRRHLSSLAVGPGAQGDVLYAASDTSGLVWALDANSGAVLSEIEVGGGPTQIIVDAARQRAYVLLNTLNQIVAIDTTSYAATNRLNLPARPIDGVLAPDGSLFITGGDASGEIWSVEPNAADIRWRVPIGGRPVGLEISADNKALYVPDSATRSLAVLTADTAQEVRSIPLASDPLAIVAIRPTQLRQRAPSASPAAAPATPAPPPQLAATPTPQPDGLIPPDRVPGNAVAEPFLSGAELPVAMAFAPDGRLFYDEQRTGNIRIVQSGTLLPDAFYTFAVTDQPDTGLLGLALDPDFQQNHFVYAAYTTNTSDAKEGASPGASIEVVRLTDAGNKGTNPVPLLQNLPAGGAHTSAAIRFGPDGKLYVSVAENEQGPNAQDLSTLAGKILRVNPDGSVPEDNPFVGDPGSQGAIWAYGLHDVTSFAFHPLGHDLLAVDSNPNASDELDFIVRGSNYGSPSSGYTNKPGLDEPLAVMNPPLGPTGSTFYTGDQIPEWQNDWFYCNSRQGQLRRVRLAAGSFDRIEFEEIVKQGCTYDVATGPDGALYYSDPRGIYRIRRPGAEVLPAVKVAY